jgi:hypothetical protein
MARGRDRAGKPPADDEYTGTWLQPLPVPEAREGGDSTWALWHQASRELDAAFGPTEPSQPAPLSVEARREPAASPAAPGSADALMVRARRNNRVCPQPAAWIRLYGELGGSRIVDLPPPPVDWIWSKLSAIQKRLFFREYLEWAERHGRLTHVAQFMDGLQEADWVHVGDA